jgi:hypothetical protein
MGFSAGFGTGIIYDKCVAKNVRDIGFELAGRAPGHDEHGHRYAQGLIDGCEVDGLSGGTFVAGISIDGACDSRVRGATRLHNITCDAPNESRGIWVAASERCSIRGATLHDAGHIYIRVTRSYVPRGSGFNEIVGNTFRNSPGSPEHRAVYIEDHNCEVGRNIVYQSPGTILSFESNTAAPTVATSDGVPIAPGSVAFQGSNLIIPA